eukprot:scaffold4085_cov113-Isochrysis_galbana.AAC.1
MGMLVEATTLFLEVLGRRVGGEAHTTERGRSILFGVHLALDLVALPDGSTGYPLPVRRAFPPLRQESIRIRRRQRRARHVSRQELPGGIRSHDAIPREARTHVRPTRRAHHWANERQVIRRLCVVAAVA